MKMWEIRENDDYRFGRKGSYGMRDHDKSFEEGYEQGYEDGYSKAMKDTFYSHEKESFGEKRGMRR